MAVAKRIFDVVVVGAGGSGMRAALQLAQAGLKGAEKRWKTTSPSSRACASCNAARIPEPPAPTTTTSKVRFATAIVFPLIPCSRFERS